MRTRAGRNLAAVGLAALALAAASPLTLDAKGHGGAPRTATTWPRASTPRAPRSPRVSVPRTSAGTIQRSAAARHAFARQTGYPNGRPGYVVDHIVPLACGGADAPSNMQWQTVEAGKMKDKTERRGC